MTAAEHKSDFKLTKLTKDTSYLAIALSYGVSILIIGGKWTVL